MTHRQSLSHTITHTLGAAKARSESLLAGRHCTHSGKVTSWPKPDSSAALPPLAPESEPLRGAHLQRAHLASAFRASPVALPAHMRRIYSEPTVQPPSHRHHHRRTRGQRGPGLGGASQLLGRRIHSLTPSLLLGGDSVVRSEAYPTLAGLSVLHDPSPQS